MTRRALSVDFEEFLACLNRHNVDYLVVGSEAVAVYGAPRYSADFDTFVAPIADNLRRALQAIEDFGFRCLARREAHARNGAATESSSCAH
jgi:hypothetical protein